MRILSYLLIILVDSPDARDYHGGAMRDFLHPFSFCQGGGAAVVAKVMRANGLDRQGDSDSAARGKRKAD
jgi:hypothetical protein